MTPYFSHHCFRRYFSDRNLGLTLMDFQSPHIAAVSSGFTREFIVVFSLQAASILTLLVRSAAYDVMVVPPQARVWCLIHAMITYLYVCRCFVSFVCFSLILRRIFRRSIIPLESYRISIEFNPTNANPKANICSVCACREPIAADAVIAARTY